MPGPAARMGDLTAHGGSIVVGFPTVLIGGMPAARLADMHVCPLVTPAVPPVPHVGGPIIGPGVPTVLIGGMPCATIGDMVTCVGPPDVIAVGCPTVMIGMAGSGAGSAGAAGAGGASGAAASAATAVFDRNVNPESADKAESAAGESVTEARVSKGLTSEATTREEHWIEFAFVDSAGLPVASVSYDLTDTEGKESSGVLPANGTVARDGIPAGNATVVLRSLMNARWLQAQAAVGEAVKMAADVDGFEAGSEAIFRVFKRDVQGPHELVQTVTAKTSSAAVEAVWTLSPTAEQEVVVPEEGVEDAATESTGYSAPDYYFEVIVGSCLARSGILYVEDFIEVEALDEEQHPLADEAYALFIRNGEVREGALDAGGKLREEKIPAGTANLRLPKLPDTEYRE